MPRWLEWRTPTRPTPTSRALDDGEIHGPGGDDLAEAFVAVDEGDGRGFGQDLEGGVGDDAAVFEHGAVACDAAHALSLAGMAAELALEAGFGLKSGLLRGGAEGEEDGFGLGF